jgi:acetyl esterase/lipase
MKKAICAKTRCQTVSETSGLYDKRKYILAGLILSVAVWLNSSIAGPAALPPRISNDVVYDAELAKFCVGDLYQPARPPNLVSPAVIVVHGGGWEAGSKDDGSTTAIVAKLLESGFVVFNVNYRLQGEGGTFPHNLDDVNHAFEFLICNAAKYRINPKEVSLVGISAGAHLALLAAYSKSWTQSRLCAVVAVAPATDLSKLNSTMILKYFPQSDPNRQKLASPVEYANFAISTLLIHGTLDSVIPFAQSEELAAALDRQHKQVELLAIKGGDHNFIVQPGYEQDRANFEIVRFLKMKGSSP